jgi:hypothetical protein
MISQVNILGIDKQDTLDESRDGTCQSLRGLIPSGNTDRPQWRVNWMGENLPIADSLRTAGDKFLNGHISRGILFLFVKNAQYHEIWKVTKTTTEYDVKTKLFRKDGSGTDVWECQFADNKEGFWITIIPSTEGQGARQFHYNHEAGESGLLIPTALPNMGNNFYIDINERNASNEIFQRDYGFYGDVPGFQKNKDKHFGFRFAMRLKNGQHARHSQPIIKSANAQVSGATKYWIDFTVGRYAHKFAFPYTPTAGTFAIGETISHTFASIAKFDGVVITETYTLTVKSVSKKYIIVEETTGTDIGRFFTEGVTFTGGTSGATGTIDGGRFRVHDEMLYGSHTQSYFDQLLEGVFVDPDNSTIYGSNVATVDMQPVPLAMAESSDGVDVFMTLPHNTIKEAIDDGVYYYVGTLTEESNTVTTNFNEEVLASREVLLPDPFSFHWVAGDSIFNFRDRLLVGGIYNNFGVPLLNYVRDDQAGAKTVTMLAFAVLLKDNKEYYIGGNMNNFCATDGNANAETLTFPQYVSYPDRDAIRIDFWWFNGTGADYEFARSFDLKKHPSLNLAYAYTSPAKTYDESNATAVVGVGSRYPITHYYEPNEYKVGDLQKGYWPLSQSYKVDSGDVIKGVISNVDEISQGQFGFYPFYILCENAIYAARQGNDVLVQSTDKLDMEHGIYNRDCFTVKNGYLWGAGGGKLWVLRGSSVEDIQYPLLLNEENSALLPVKAIGRMFTREAVIFAGQTENFVYDIRYRVWYSYTPKYLSTSNITAKHFIEYLGNTYEFADLTGVDSVEIVNGITNLDSQVKSSEDVSVNVKTNPVKFTDSTQYKRMYSSILKGKFVIANGDTLTIAAKGVRSTHDAEEVLISYAETDRTLNNIVVRGRGNWQGYVFEITGTLAANSDSYIEKLLIDYIVRAGRLKL